MKQRFRPELSITKPSATKFWSFWAGDVCQRTPWGGEKKRGEENLTNETPPKKGFWTPLVRYVFHPPRVSVLCFSCTKIHDRADQKLVWRGPKTFGRVRSLVRFPPPIRFAPPHITAQVCSSKIIHRKSGRKSAQSSALQSWTGPSVPVT